MHFSLCFADVYHTFICLMSNIGEYFWIKCDLGQKCKHHKLTRPGFELMTSRSRQYVSCHWDAYSNHLAISDCTDNYPVLCCVYFHGYWQGVHVPRGKTDPHVLLHLLVKEDDGCKMSRRLPQMGWWNLPKIEGRMLKSLHVLIHLTNVHGVLIYVLVSLPKIL